MVLQSVDHAFSLPEVDLAAPRAYWTNGFCSDFLLISLSDRLWERMECEVQAPVVGQFDMNILNKMFRKDHTTLTRESRNTQPSIGDQRNTLLVAGDSPVERSGLPTFTLFSGSTTGKRLFDYLESNGAREYVGSRTIRSRTGEIPISERGATRTEFAPGICTRTRLRKCKGTSFFSTGKAMELASRLSD